MSVHSVFYSVLNNSSRERYAGFCLIGVGSFLLSFCFSCTQCPWDAVRSFLGCFSARENPALAGVYVT